MAEQVSPPRTTREVAEAILVDERERGKLFAFAYSRFQISRDDAEDLLQETALELLRLRTYVHDPEAFVFTVFRARCARFIGGLLARRAVFSDSPLMIENATESMGVVEQFDRQVAMRQAFDSISSACRRLLAAFYVEGVDLREAAKRESLAYSSASKTLSRCIKKLRESMS